MKGKLTLGLWVSTCLLCLPLAGCSLWSTPTPWPMPTATPMEAPLATSPPATPTSASPLEVTITLWEQEEEMARTTVLYPLIDEFRQENPGIRVEVSNFATAELRQKLLATLGTGQGPDVVRAPNSFVGQLAPLGALMPARNMFEASFLDSFLAGTLAGGILTGTLWAVPECVGNHLMLLYNKALISSPPGDSQAMVAMAAAATDEQAGVWGLVYNTQDPLWLVPWLAGFGGWVLDESTDMPTLDTPAMVEALGFLRDLTLEYKVVPAGCDYETARVAFAEGRAAMVIDGTWSLAGYAATSGLEFRTVPLPKVVSTGLWPTPMVEGRYYMVSKEVAVGTAEFEAVRRLVEFLTGEQAQGIWLEKMERLPSNKQVAQSSVVTEEPTLAGSVAQLEKSRGRPPAMQLDCVWDSARSGLPGVLAGRIEPADAARKMQEDAERCAGGAQP